MDLTKKKSEIKSLVNLMRPVSASFVSPVYRMSYGGILDTRDELLEILEDISIDLKNSNSSKKRFFSEGIFCAVDSDERPLREEGLYRRDVEIEYQPGPNLPESFKSILEELGYVRKK